MLGATESEIAAILKCSQAALKRHAGEIRMGRAQRLIRLREWQWKLASDGNAQMQIWLSKCELGQSDKALPREEVAEKEVVPEMKTKRG